jgi:hypothetical protein
MKNYCLMSYAACFVIMRMISWVCILQALCCWSTWRALALVPFKAAADPAL